MSEVTEVRSSLPRGIRGRLVAVWQGVQLFPQVFPAMLAALGATVAISFLGLGVGIFMVPMAMLAVRRLAEYRRRMAERWQGVEIPSPYRPQPVFKEGAAGQVQRCVWLLSDPASWRDLLWATVDPVVGAFLALVPIGLILYGIYGSVISIMWKPFTRGGFNDWYLIIHVSPLNSGYTWSTAVLGLPLIVLGVWCAPAVLAAHTRWSGMLLGPTSGELARRVQHLTETRTDAVDAQAAEIRRIERDLHDGAQARLVAMGMNLNAAAALLEKDPDAARTLLFEARDSSAKALTELRDLVRGIHPPVLADRGLVDAVRALALDSALDVEVVADSLGRLEAPLESAAYFAVGEALTNAAKHSEADHVRIEIWHTDDRLWMTVTDDGKGGADAAAGTGLRGMERRLATFDGILALSSPPGGPTVVTMELPCASSSPKTSSS